MSALSSTRRFPALRLAAASTMLVALLAAGCGGPEQTAGLATPPASGESSATPSPTLPPYTTTLTLTEEQKRAANAALIAMVKFQNVVDKINATGGHGTDSLNTTSTGQAKQNNLDEAALLRNNNQHIQGETNFDGYKLEHVRLGSPARDDRAVFRSCLRVGTAKLVDKDGKDVNPGAAKDSIFEYQIDYIEGKWLVSKETVRSEPCD